MVLPPGDCPTLVLLSVIVLAGQQPWPGWPWKLTWISFPHGVPGEVMGPDTHSICVPIVVRTHGYFRLEWLFPEFSRVTVHAGNALDTLSKSIVSEPLCFSLK